MCDHIITGLASSDPKVKERSADEVTDVAKNMPENEVQKLAQALVEQVLADSSAPFREAALNALCELREWHPLSSSMLAPLRSLDMAAVVGSEKEHLENLLKG